MVQPGTTLEMKITNEDHRRAARRGVWRPFHMAASRSLAGNLFPSH
jgi:hypothetical protein